MNDEQQVSYPEIGFKILRPFQGKLYNTVYQKFSKSLRVSSFNFSGR